MDRSFRTLLIVASALTACAPAVSPVDEPRQEAWNAFAHSVPLDPEGAATAVNSFATKYGIPFEFWADSTVDSTRFSLEEAPCGSVAAGSARRLPRTSPSGLSVDLAVEIDSTGKELGRWPIPMDGPVTAIRDATIYVPYLPGGGAPTLALAIEGSGRFRVVAPPVADSVIPFDCPAIEAFKGSDYTNCYWVEDLNTHARRRLAWQGVCT